MQKDSAFFSWVALFLRWQRTELARPVVSITATAMPSYFGLVSFRFLLNSGAGLRRDRYSDALWRNFGAQLTRRRVFGALRCMSMVLAYTIAFSY